MPRGKNKRTRESVGDLFLINEVSRLVDLSQKRIREYEKEGFIRPLREANTNNRLYSPFEVSQIKRINGLIHERGFTLACLRTLLVMAPCWNIFDCPEKEKCPAYQLPWRPCYEVRGYRDTLCGGPCERCAVYLNRNIQKEKILEQFPGPR